MANVQSPKTDVAFEVNEFIVYPSHGVGQIVGIEKQEVAGLTLELFVIDFEREKMKLRVPLSKIKQVGMRKLSSTKTVEKALTVMGGRARIKRTMWSRRAQEYEGKINSGDLIFVAEVVRDLHRADNQPEQSYSERQLFEQAIDRVVREIASARNITETEGHSLVMKSLAKSAAQKKDSDSEEAAA